MAPKGFGMGFDPHPYETHICMCSLLGRSKVAIKGLPADAELPCQCCLAFSIGGASAEFVDLHGVENTTTSFVLPCCFCYGNALSLPL
jgi:hypothetical protein